MTIQKLSAWVPVADEDVLDYLIGSDAEQAAAGERIAARQAESLARWKALPWYEKMRRNAMYGRRRYEWPHRLSVAIDVLRGRHECEP
jgi:hypothetical protein